MMRLVFNEEIGDQLEGVMVSWRQLVENVGV